MVMVVMFVIDVNEGVFEFSSLGKDLVNIEGILKL